MAPDDLVSTRVLRFCKAVRRGEALCDILHDDAALDRLILYYVEAWYGSTADAVLAEQRMIVMQHCLNRDAVRGLWRLLDVDVSMGVELPKHRPALEALFTFLRAEDARIGPVVEAD